MYLVLEFLIFDPKSLWVDGPINPTRPKTSFWRLETLCGPPTVVSEFVLEPGLKCFEVYNALMEIRHQRKSYKRGAVLGLKGVCFRKQRNIFSKKRTIVHPSYLLKPVKSSCRPVELRKLQARGGCFWVVSSFGRDMDPKWQRLVVLVGVGWNPSW